MSETHDGRVLERVPLDGITPGPNVRTEYGDLESLAASIREHGVLTPLLLRRLSGDEPYELVAGGRRYRAALLAGVADVPAQVETPEALDTAAEVRRVLALPEAARTLIDEGVISLTTAAGLAATEDEEIVARALTLVFHHERLLESEETNKGRRTGVKPVTPSTGCGARPWEVKSA